MEKTLFEMIIDIFSNSINNNNHYEGLIEADAITKEKYEGLVETE